MIGPRGVRRAALLAAGAVLLATGGCGGSAPQPVPAEAVPTLAVTLESVDALIAEGRWVRARAQLRSLIADANAARESGELSGSEADRIVAAATRLLAALPAPAPSVTPTPTTATAPSGGGARGEDEKDRDDDKGKGENKGKGRGDD